MYTFGKPSVVGILYSMLFMIVTSNSLAASRDLAEPAKGRVLVCPALPPFISHSDGPPSDGTIS